MRTREQRRASHAYACVRAVPDGQREDYKVAVNAIGPNVIRSGLAAAIAFMERKRKLAGWERLLNDLGRAEIPGLENCTAKTLPDAVRALDLEGYMVATRETLRVAHWFKRAVQATFGDDAEKSS